MSKRPANIPRTLKEALTQGYRKIPKPERRALAGAGKAKLVDCSDGNHKGEICASGEDDQGRPIIYVCDGSGNCDEEQYVGPH